MASNPLELLPEANAVHDELRRQMAAMSPQQKATFLLACARLAAAQADQLRHSGRPAECGRRNGNGAL